MFYKIDCEPTKKEKIQYRTNENSFIVDKT
jgi:hypothetical protein